MRRFTEGGFARFNGSAPLPASTAEGPGEPIRHRYNPAGNRRIDAILYRMAISCAANHAPKDLRQRARRRAQQEGSPPAPQASHLSDVIYRRMIHDLEAQLADQALLAA